jgi:hypothetical protein
LLPALLGNRLLSVTFYANVDDANSKKSAKLNIHLFTTNLAYNFTKEGKTSISVEHWNGTDRNTLEKPNQ